MEWVFYGYVGWSALFSVVTFLVYGWDKHQAKKNRPADNRSPYRPARRRAGGRTGGRSRRPAQDASRDSSRGPSGGPSRGPGGRSGGTSGGPSGGPGGRGGRVSEKRLHQLELLGGWPGALIAQKVFRHKTVKTSYRLVFFAIVALHLLALGGLTYLWLR